MDSAARSVTFVIFITFLLLEMDLDDPECCLRFSATLDPVFDCSPCSSVPVPSEPDDIYLYLSVEAMRRPLHMNHVTGHRNLLRTQARHLKYLIFFIGFLISIMRELI